MAQQFLFYILILSVFSSIFGELNPLPDYIKVCRKSDLNFDKCFVNAIEILRPKIAKGMPELNIPPLEPLDLGDLVISKKQDTGIDISVKNLRVYNATTFKITNFKSENFVGHLTAELLLPRFEIEGFYSVEGRLLALPLKGSGDFHGSFSNIRAKVKFDVGRIEKNGVEYFKLSQINIKAKMGKGRIKLNNLFDGNKELSNVINDSINDNIIAIANDILPSIEKALEKKFSEIGKKVFEIFTANQLLPN
ncbi:protein takeout-like [Condylostylus longicornis]|uniref:protein takeout-like n=1 Tax=Condylostylus longicornis TaxID=2530218 RepID=UPI00244DCD30|nr:protein takeout-like [Condylostylus longicornis]